MYVVNNFYKLKELGSVYINLVRTRQFKLLLCQVYHMKNSATLNVSIGSKLIH
jgi:hypothetical protein